MIFASLTPCSLRIVTALTTVLPVPVEIHQYIQYTTSAYNINPFLVEYPRPVYIFSLTLPFLFAA